MAIVKMKRLRVIALAREQEALLDRLQQVGCLEIIQAEPSGEEGLSRRGSTALGQISGDLGKVQAALDALDRYAPAKEGPLTPRPLVTREQLFDPWTTQNALKETGQINQALEELRQAEGEENRLLALRERLLPWRELDLDLALTGTASTALLLGTLPAQTEWNALQSALAQEAPLCELTQVGEDREQRYVLLLCHKSQQQAAQELLSSWSFAQTQFQGTQGTPRENLEAAEAALVSAREQKAQAAAAIQARASSRKRLRLTLDRLALAAEKEAGKENCLATQETVLLEGWFTAPEEGALLQVLGEYTCAWEIADPEEGEYPQVPVKLQNSKLVKPLNLVTEMYSLPAYGSLDPNPLMFPFFVFFYGMMMADMAYGLIMMAISLVVCRKKRPRGNIFQLIGLCGVSAFFWGAATGGFLGDFPSQLARLIDPESTFALPALFTPLDDTLMILVGAMALGGVQIITGMAINFYKLTRRGQLKDALMDVGSWWLLFAGIALGVLAGNWILALLGVLALVLTQGRSAPTLIGKLVGGVSSLYDITGYFGDVLSYARLMALMLAGSVIAQVFNTLGAIPGNIFIFILVSLVGNTLNFGLNLLGCYVHDLRLQCLEYFGKFYEDGGRPFRPLSVHTEYVDLKETRRNVS